MPFQFTTIEESSFSRGIDARSAENQIRDGFVRDLVNADIVEGRVKKRKGYAPFAGDVPLRVMMYRQPEVGKAIVSLDGSIDLSRVTPGPILVYGRTSSEHIANNPFTSTIDRAWWFTSWETNLRKIFNSSTPNGSITATPAEHSIPTSDMYVGVSENTDIATDTLTGELLTTSITVQSDRTIQVNYSNNRTSDVKVFLYYLDRTPTAGETYAQTFTTTSASQSFSILATVHELATSNIVYQLYQQVGATWAQAKPDSFTCSTSGDITFTVTAPIGTVFRMILSSVPDSQSVEAGSTVVLPTMPNSYLFYTCYNGTSEIIPDTVKFNDVTKETTFTFSGEEVPESIRVCYAQGIIRTNEIYLNNAAIATGTASFSGDFASTFVDTSPQLTLYGINHSIAYGDEKKQYRRGWVNHIDSYRSPSTSHMVVGLGGNLYSARSPEELGDSNIAVAMPTYYPDLFTRVNAETWVGPAFIDSTVTSTRSRGAYSFANGESGWANVTAVAYNSSTGYTDYTLATPGRIKTGTPIDETDYLTVQGMSSSRHQGTFKITAINESSSSQLVISVVNAQLDSADYDDQNTSGYAGVFTDSFIFKPTLTNPFLPGDQLLSSSWGEETIFTITDSNDTATTRVYFGGCTKLTRLGASLAITGRRTSATIPLRTVSRSPSVDYLIPGDTLTFSEIDDPLQIVSVDATATTITVDRTITWADTIALPPTFSVAARWIPVEAPTETVTEALVDKTSVRYFTSADYDNQPFLRSAMVQNNLYLTNGSDEVYKYDGQHNYRAGIIPWQPGLFLTAQVGDVGGIPLSGFTPVTVSSLDGEKLAIAKSSSLQFVVGQLYLFSNASGFNQLLTLASNVEKDNSTHYLTFVEPLDFTLLGTSPVLTTVYTARYSFRLNVKDVNGVTTASAVTGAEDFVATIAPTTSTAYKVHLRLVGLPSWDQYDFRNKNIEVEIYRTLWSLKSLGDVPVFYRLPQTKTCSFNISDGYIDIVDTYGNNTLVQEDSVVSVLSPSTVPVGWDEPPRAKYTTTAGNRLVLANLIDWPTMAIAYLPSGTITNSTFSGQVFNFYKDSSSTTSTIPDMVNHVAYELISDTATYAKTISSITPAASTFTVNLGAAPARTVAAGDWVYLYFTSSNGHPLSASGWWQIANPITQTQLVINGTISAIDTTMHPMSALFSTAAKVVPVNINSDYNMGMYNGQVVGFKAPEIRIIRRIGMAINATMRMVDVSIPAYSSFKPWLVARSESDTGGQLIVRQPRAETTTPAVKVSSTPVPTYLNGSQLTALTAVAAAVTRYPSRLAVSYDNYPEIFDNLWVVNAHDSDSVIDVNSADGQEITGVIPFFGESAFGAAQKAGVLLVFKQNSIYLVNIANKLAGTESVQRLETQGLGCTAPYSIAPTKNGIMFANESGIYALRTDQQIEYMGRFMERNWQEKVDLGALAIAQGHHYGVGRQYKLSVPMVAESSNSYAENSQVYVYNHTAEADGELGGWTRYTNHPVTGWANLFQDAFLASANGSVMKVRNLGGVTDYRDGNVAIESILAARANAFGNTGIRKSVSNLVVHYRSGANSEYTQVYMSPDFFEEFQLSTKFQVVTKGISDGLSTLSNRSVVSVVHSFPRRRCVYMSIKIINNGIDDNVEIAGMSYIVAGMDSAGIKQAAETY